MNCQHGSDLSSQTRCNVCKRVFEMLLLLKYTQIALFCVLKNPPHLMLTGVTVLPGTLLSTILHFV